MALQGPKSQPQTSTCGLDFLYCHEETWVDLRLNNFQEEEEERGPTSTTSFTSFGNDNDNDDNDDDDDDDQRLIDLISKEEKERISLDLTPLMMVAGGIRRDAVEWMMMVNAHHGFSTLTLVLAVNYFDRFILSSSQDELFHKIPNFDVECVPWVTQLASIACLSLASKIEETHVPLLLDFQIDCKYSFDAKTIRRMELLVLSTLEWKMNPVTPFSYFEHLTKKLRWKTHLQQQILWRSQSLVLSFIAEPRYLCYTPSAVAAAVALHAMRELEDFDPIESEILLMDALRISKNKIEECCQFISEFSGNNQANKRRRICSSFSGSISPIQEETEEGFCRWRVSYSEAIDQITI